MDEIFRTIAAIGVIMMVFLVIIVKSLLTPDDVSTSTEWRRKPPFKYVIKSIFRRHRIINDQNQHSKLKSNIIEVMGVTFDLENYLIVETRTEAELNADLKLHQMNYQTQNKSVAPLISNTPALGIYSVCQLDIDLHEDFFRCPSCKALSHQDHFLEWIKIKGFCPNCAMKMKLMDLLMENRTQNF